MKAKWIIKPVLINNHKASENIYYKVYRKRWYHFFSYGRVEGKEYLDGIGFGSSIEPYLFKTVFEAEEYIQKKMTTPSFSGLNDAIVVEYE